MLCSREQGESCRVSPWGQGPTRTGGSSHHQAVPEIGPPGPNQGARQAAEGGSSVSQSTKSLHISDVPSELRNANLKIKRGIERAALKCAHHRVKTDSGREAALQCGEGRLALVTPRGVGWGRSWWEAQEGAELCAPTANSHSCRAETNTIW